MCVRVCVRGLDHYALFFVRVNFLCASFSLRHFLFITTSPHRNANQNNEVSNNVLEQGGFVYQEGCGVLAQSVANVNISHNLIQNFSYTGVSLGWTWGYAATTCHDNYVGFNMINNIGLGLLSDMGCIYTLGKQPGSQIINNVCHSVESYDYGGWAYYTDEGSTNITFTNNIAYNIKCAGHHQHYGMDNKIFNNIYAYVNTQGCDGAVRSSQHSGNTVDCQHIQPSEGEDQGQCSSLRFLTNIVYAQAPSLFAVGAPYSFINSTLDTNVYWLITGTPKFPTNTSDMSWAKWQSEGKDGKSTVADPQFVNPSAMDFTDLKPSSPALARVRQ